MAHPLEQLVELDEATPDVALDGAERQPTVSAISAWLCSSQKARKTTVRRGSGSSWTACRTTSRSARSSSADWSSTVRASGSRDDGGDPVGVAGSGSPDVGDLVAGDPDQPGRQRGRARGQRVATAPGRDEHLLGDVLGVVRVAAAPGGRRCGPGPTSGRRRARARSRRRRRDERRGRGPTRVRPRGATSLTASWRQRTGPTGWGAPPMVMCSSPPTRSCGLQASKCLRGRAGAARGRQRGRSACCPC